MVRILLTVFIVTVAIKALRSNFTVLRLNLFAGAILLAVNWLPGLVMACEWIPSWFSYTELWRTLFVLWVLTAIPVLMTTDNQAE